VKLAIPALALAECLCGFDPRNHIVAVQEVKKWAFVAPFNELASMRLGGIYRELMLAGYKLPKAHHRQVAKHDFSIAASCLAAGVSVLVQEDNDYKDLGKLATCKSLKFANLQGATGTLFP
jgi:predicted nucleic acid-binding protein